MAAASLGLAAVAAVCNAFSSVFQRKANRDEPADRTFAAGLLDVVRRPAWLLGALAMIVSFLLQATALKFGTLSSVEPILVIELPLTLIIGAWLLRHPLHKRDWISAAAMAFGLALFIAVLDPTGGEASSISEATGIIATAATAAGIGGLVLAGRFGPARARAALFGAAAGAGFGLTASLLKVSVAHLSDGGPVALLTTWETYGFAVCGVLSIVLVQAALRSGTLVAAQPGITLLDPMVSVLWGTVVLRETTRTGPAVIVAAVGGLIIVAAVLVLVRSAAVQARPHEERWAAASGRAEVH
jgi:drug/metabolite transporter (DMT)-like permease